MKVDRKAFNDARVKYRKIHDTLKEYDLGFTGFLTLMETLNVALPFTANRNPQLELTSLAAARVKALLSDHPYTLLKAADAKYKDTTDAI